MYKPRRHRKRASLGYVVASLPLVSAVSLQELGLTSSVIANEACSVALRTEIPRCSLDDFATGCSESCKVSIATVANNVAVACAGPVLSDLLAPLVSTSGQLLLCANGFFSSIFGGSSSVENSPIGVTTLTIDVPPQTIVPPLAITVSTLLSMPMASSDPALRTSMLGTASSNSTYMSLPATSVPAATTIFPPFVIPVIPSSALTSSPSPLPPPIISVIPVPSSLLSSSASLGSPTTSSVVSPTPSSGVPTMPTLSPTSIAPAMPTSLPSGVTLTPPPTSSTITIPSLTPSTSFGTQTSAIASSKPGRSNTTPVQSSTTSSVSLTIAPNRDPATSTPEAANQDRSKSPNVSIIGGVIGGSVGFAAAVTLLFYICLRRRRSKRGSGPPRRISSWDFIDRRRRQTGNSDPESVMSLPPVAYAYFDQPDMPPIAPQDATFAGRQRSSTAGSTQYGQPIVATATKANMVPRVSLGEGFGSSPLRQYMKSDSQSKPHLVPVTSNRSSTGRKSSGFNINTRGSFRPNPSPIAEENQDGRESGNFFAQNLGRDSPRPGLKPQMRPRYV